MKSVLVLMSTYNGEQYLREQLDSIFSQEDVEISLLVRDDGSNDNTLQILYEYSLNYDIKVIKGKNINWMHSFWTLVNMASGYDLYAFSDQDDIWDNDKLKRAIGILEKYHDIPVIYCANQRLVDKECNVIDSFEDKVDISRFTPQDLLVWGNLFRGCTEVWNDKLQKYILGKKIVDIDEPHDAFIMLICLLIGGKVIKDNADVMSYRQHEDNALGAQKRFNRMCYIANNIIGRNGMRKPFSSRIKKVYSIIGDDTNDEIKYYVEKVCNYDKSFGKTIGLAFSIKFPNITIKKRIQILFRKF